MTTASERVAGAEVSPGTVCVCTPDDRPALTELYLAAFPNANAEDLIPSLSGAEVSWWAALKNDQGDISVALYVKDGGMMVFVKPERAESREIRDGFVTLAEEVFRVLKLSGVRSLTVVLPPSLRRLGEVLERSGVLSKETLIVRDMHFTDSAEVARPKLVPRRSGSDPLYSIPFFNLDSKEPL